MSSDHGKPSGPGGGRPLTGGKRTADATLIVPPAVKDAGPGALTATVTVLTGQNTGVVIELKNGVSDMGRGSDVDIPLADAGLSRRHARIVASAGVYTIEDLGSTNGTFLNGVQVTDRVAMESGARIQVGETTLLRFALLDMHEQAAAKRMYEMTVRDPLTSLHNRRHLDERFKGEFAFATRHKSALTVFIIDVDHFKKINDTRGHPAGDEVLRAMAVSLQKMVRTEDVVARFGGEEFVVVARGIDQVGTTLFGERLRAGVEAMRVPWESGELRLTASIGVAHYDAQHEYASTDEMLAAADGALYRAKHGGRNQVVIADRE